MRTNNKASQLYIVKEPSNKNTSTEDNEHYQIHSDKPNHKDSPRDQGHPLGSHGGHVPLLEFAPGRLPRQEASNRLARFRVSRLQVGDQVVKLFLN